MKTSQSAFDLKPTTAAPHPTSDSKRAQKARRPMRVNFDVPAALMNNIRDRAMAEGLTLRGFMLKLLAAEGLEADADARIDGRTRFAARRATSKRK